MNNITLYLEDENHEILSSDVKRNKPVFNVLYISSKDLISLDD